MTGNVVLLGALGAELENGSSNPSESSLRPSKLTTAPIRCRCTTDEVLDALGRYTKDSKESDRQTATKLVIRRSVLWDCLRGGIQPEKCALTRLAGFLKRVGYL
jgi:hypothetical protein